MSDAKKRDVMELNWVGPALEGLAMCLTAVPGLIVVIRQGQMNNRQIKNTHAIEQIHGDVHTVKAKIVDEPAANADHTEL
jgi:hypothetical protein